MTKKLKEPDLESLTDREHEVLKLIADEALSNKELADRLKISDHTIKFHVANALKKLGTSSRVRGAVIYALHKAAA